MIRSCNPYTLFSSRHFQVGLLLFPLVCHLFVQLASSESPLFSQTFYNLQRIVHPYRAEYRYKADLADAKRNSNHPGRQRKFCDCPGVYMPAYDRHGRKFRNQCQLECHYKLHPQEIE